MDKRKISKIDFSKNRPPITSIQFRQHYKEADKLVKWSSKKDKRNLVIQKGFKAQEAATKNEIKPYIISSLMSLKFKTGELLSNVNEKMNDGWQISRNY